MKLIYENSSIECLSAQLISRKIMPSAFIEIKTIGKCFTYKCYRNSEATILKELIPKDAIYNEYSCLEKDTKIECENLFIAIAKIKPYQPEIINHSHTHKAQKMITKEYTYAKISRQIQNIPTKIPLQEIKLTQIQSSKQL